MKSDWPADHVERRAIEALIPYVNNARTHSDAQVAIVQRWQDFTGQTATLDGNGRTFAELSAERLPMKAA